MEATRPTTSTRPTHEEVRQMFFNAKARLAAKEARIRAMYEEELRMKAKAKKQRTYELEFA